MPEVILNGPHGRIECRYHSGQSPDSPIALILHPEPNQGGSMNNFTNPLFYSIPIRIL